MSHTDEYHDAMVTMLELIWGVGYMAPGGPGNVAKLLSGLEPAGKKILDIGSGIGGPAMEMVETHAAEVTGIDLEPGLVARANADAQSKGIAERCLFHQVEVGPLGFADNSFDIVVSSGALTQTADKLGMFAEIRRVLKPGGWFTAYDWMKIPGDYSDDMLYWFKMEGLTYALVTMEEQASLLVEAGFESVESEDATDWYQREAQREYELIKGDLYAELVEAIGQADADHFVENWRAMVQVIDNGEMRQVYFRGQNPI